MITCKVEVSGSEAVYLDREEAIADKLLLNKRCCILKNWREKWQNYN
ncbi:MAG: hypothetical protein SAL07_01225 [Oscillatoria sp. PMC 1051.18]|nr:hypothetical protein [Oscillatoria sp. PMC 1050.18]MEC5028505.1 hypothetical protein [Oscillatoria sp. PMC 1051.18]